MNSEVFRKLQIASMIAAIVTATATVLTFIITRLPLIAY
jgi:hypothetical protein